MFTWQTQGALPTLCYQTNHSRNFWANYSKEESFLHLSLHLQQKCSSWSPHSKGSSPQIKESRTEWWQHWDREMYRNKVWSKRIKASLEIICALVCMWIPAATLCFLSLKGLSGVIAAMWRWACREKAGLFTGFASLPWDVSCCNPVLLC